MRVNFRASLSMDMVVGKENEKMRATKERSLDNFTAEQLFERKL